jgi:D-alanyl-D-alanine carboxypeptidase
VPAVVGVGISVTSAACPTISHMNHNTNTTTNEVRPIRSTWSRPRRLVACLAGLAVVASAAPASASPGSPNRAGKDRHRSTARLQRALDDVVAAGAPGAVLLVRVGDRTIRLTSGQSNLAPETPMRANLRTRIGGVTKSFTATVVLQLVTEGKLALDNTVEQWLPGAISNGSEITIRQLLNHTSGVFNYTSDPTILAPYIEGDFTRIFDPLHGVEVAAQYGPQFAPGTAFDYSNTNYLLLAMIVEAVTGHGIASELHKRIIRPLGLHHTSYPTSSEIVGPHIHGYVQSDATQWLDVTPFSPTLYGASGAILSNADDVARFYRALLRGRLLGPDELVAMQTIDPVATGGVPDAGILGGGWGLGLLRETFPCGEAWGHDSETPGYMTAAWNSNDGARQVVVIVNSHFGHDEPVSQAMRDLLVTAYCGQSQ